MDIILVLARDTKLEGVEIAEVDNILVVDTTISDCSDVVAEL